MLPDTDRAGAIRVISQIISQIEDLNMEHKRSKVSGTVSVSIGGATYRNAADGSLDESIRLAYDALHDAKLKPSERVVIYNPARISKEFQISVK